MNHSASKPAGPEIERLTLASGAGAPSHVTVRLGGIALPAPIGTSTGAVELGVITLTSVATDSAAEERKLAFDPTRLTDGIELSDDPLPKLRSLVYAISAAPRRHN